MPALSKPTGLLTPLITPFRSDVVDLTQLATLVDRQIQGGIDGLILCDQTGEGPTLSHDERNAVISCTLEAAAGRVPIVAALGTNSTAGTIEAIAAAPVEIAALLITVPYYSRPTAKGIICHFRQIAQATPLPLIIDDDPGRTAKALTVEILQELSDVTNIIGIRHCSGDLAAFTTMPRAIKQRFIHYAGDDRTALSYLMSGASSMSSPMANARPRLVRAVYDLAQAHKRSGHNRLRPRLLAALNDMGPMEPPGIKDALSRITNCDRQVRLPLISD